MSLTRDMAVVWRSTGDLSPHPQNPRTHSDAQLEQLFASIQRFGWTCPLIVDEDLTVLAGHGRLQMADLNRIEQVPTIQIVGLSEEEKRAYLIADNRLSENADWDIPALLGELEWLAGHAIEADTIGFSDADVLAMHASVDDVGEFPAPDERGFGGRIQSATEPTQLQQNAGDYVGAVETAGGPSADVAATLVPFSLMLPVDDRERVYAVLNRLRGDAGTMADALMLVIDAYDAEADERIGDDGQD